MSAKRKRILAVDDDATALGALRQLLSQRGYDVTTTTSGEDALEKIGSGFDLFILDVIMPGMSGYDLCRRIRENPATQDTPVIFLTAKSLLMDMAEGQDAGSDLYLVKPVPATKLLNMVGMFLADDAPLARRPRGGDAPT